MKTRLQSELMRQFNLVPRAFPLGSCRQLLVVYSRFFSNVVICTAGDPEPAIAWRKDGKVLRNGHKYSVRRDGQLIIKHAQYNDSGVYECMARTNRERTEAFTNLVVRGTYEDRVFLCFLLLQVSSIYT